MVLSFVNVITQTITGSNLKVVFRLPHGFVVCEHNKTTECIWQTTYMWHLYYFHRIVSVNLPGGGYALFLVQLMKFHCTF